MVVHGAKPFAVTAMAALGYLGGSVAYVAIPLIIVAVMARAKPAVLADIVWPHDAERRLVALAFWLPLLLPALLIGGVLAGLAQLIPWFRGRGGWLLILLALLPWLVWGLYLRAPPPAATGPPAGVQMPR